MVTVRFETITRKRVMVFACRNCAHRTTRTAKVERTVNPFNKNEDGTVKSWLQVSNQADAALGTEMSKVQKREEAEPCTKCGGTRREYQPHGKR